MEDPSEQLYQDVVSCLDAELDSYTDVEFVVREGGRREVNRSDVFVVVVDVDGERVSDEQVVGTGGAIEKALVENGFSKENFVVSSVSQRPNLFDVMVGVGVHEQF